jgi:hypothetical protein
MVGSGNFLSSFPAERAVRARAALAVDDETPVKSLVPCMTTSWAIDGGGTAAEEGILAGVGGVCGCVVCCVGDVMAAEESANADSSSLRKRTSRARHFLSKRRHRSHESAVADQVH